MATAEGPEIACCYCGRRFTPKFSVEPDRNMSPEQARAAAELCVDFVQDGIPLECGKCRAG